VVVDIDPERVFSLTDLADLRLFLRDVFGRETDVVIRGDLRPKFRDRIAADELGVF
jgi:predicted nucleotidyltransferase